MKEKEPEIEPRQLDSRSRDLKQPETSVPLPPCLLASLPRASHGPFQPEPPDLTSRCERLDGWPQPDCPSHRHPSHLVQGMKRKRGRKLHRNQRPADHRSPRESQSSDARASPERLHHGPGALALPAAHHGGAGVCREPGRRGLGVSYHRASTFSLRGTNICLNLAIWSS